MEEESTSPLLQRPIYKGKSKEIVTVSHIEEED